jgi:lipoprotein-releasing system permease protein
MYKWFLAFRYLYTKLIAFFAVASVMLCVAMVLVVMSVMGGFLDTVRARSRGLLAEIVVESGSAQGFPYYAEFADFLKTQLPEAIGTVTPVIRTYGVFRVPSSSWTRPAHVTGIRLDEYAKVNDFQQGLYYARYYPGTTHLGPQKMPVAGMNDRGKMVLPPELVEANNRWRAAPSDPDEIKAYDDDPFSYSPFPFDVPSVPGERVFAADLGEPRYEGDEFAGVIVGADLLHQRRPDGDFDRYLARGGRVAISLLPLTESGNITGEPPVLLPARYVDDSRTGIYEIDSMSVYVDFDVLQHRLAMDPQERVDGGVTRARASQLLIDLKDGILLNAGRDQIAEAWARFAETIAEGMTDSEYDMLIRVGVYTWEDMQRPFIAAVEKEKVLVTFLFTLISMVAIVLIGCIFYMIVEKKIKDIGILKALGASGRGVAAMFIVYAAAIGIVGCALGTILGSAVVWNINEIQDFLATLNPQLRVWSPDVYSFDRIPNVVKRADAVWIAGFAVLSSMIGSLIPAFVAGRIWPVKALRYE